MKKFFLLFAIMIGTAHAECGSSLPFGRPNIPNAINICHTGYFTAYSPEVKMPLFVAWTLTSDHALGCNGRVGSFVNDPMAGGKDIPPSSYIGSGFDKGHLADANDFNYDPALESQTFYMTNMTPQVPGMNRGPWKWVESATRDWAVEHKQVLVYAGPVISPFDSKFSSYKIDIPKQYWKIVIDATTGQSISFLMDNSKFSSTQVPSTITSIHNIEAKVGFTIPVPYNVQKLSVSSLTEWKVDMVGFNNKHKLLCHK